MNALKQHPTAKLIFTDTHQAGQVYELTLEKTTVGRGPQNTLVIPDHSVSSAQCEILAHGPEVIVRDLGSRNGTYVNGVRLINQQAQLKPGQTVRFGSVEARLELDAPPVEDTATDMTAIHLMGRIQREQKWEQEHPKSAAGSRKLAPPVSSPGDDGTITMLTTPPPKTSVVPAAPVPAGSQTEKTSRKAPLVIAAVLALGLIVLFWLWCGRK